MEIINLTAFLRQILNNIRTNKKRRNVLKVTFKRPPNILLARSNLFSSVINYYSKRDNSN